MSLSDSLSSLQDFDINDLDFNNAGSWPAPVKIICYLLLIAIVLGAVYWFDIKELNSDLERKQREEADLKQQFEFKASQVANLEEYKLQMSEMETTFGALLKQLPSDTEVPGLLEDISTVGSRSGLELSSIDLQPEVSREFYIELPIDISLRGTYHDIAAFVSGVAGLPRIVTLHDFEIETERSEAERLAMTIKARTYRYNDGEEE